MSRCSLVNMCSTCVASVPLVLHGLTKLNHRLAFNDLDDSEVCNVYGRWLFYIFLPEDYTDNEGAAANEGWRESSGGAAAAIEGGAKPLNSVPVIVPARQFRLPRTLRFTTGLTIMQGSPAGVDYLIGLPTLVSTGLLQSVLLGLQAEPPWAENLTDTDEGYCAALGDLVGG